MKATETRVLVLWWGLWKSSHGHDSNDAHWGNIAPKLGAFQAQMTDALHEINRGRWTIAGTLPVDQAVYYGTGLVNKAPGSQTWGGGYGYGGSGTAGTTLILQREIDDAGSSAAAQRATAYEEHFKRAMAAWEIRATEIEKQLKKISMFKTVDQYVFDGVAFDTMQEAWDARDMKAMKAEFCAE